MALTTQTASHYSRRNKLLRELGFPSYATYLTSPLWHSIRLRVWHAAGWRCFGCGYRPDQVHHDRYDRATLKGATLDHLYAVCATCHKWAEFLHGSKLSPRQATLRLKKRRKERLERQAKRPPLDTIISPA